MSWADYTSVEKLAAVAAGLEAGLSQREMGEKHGTTANAITGFISRNSKVLGVIRANPESSRAQPKQGVTRDSWSENKLTERWVKRARTVTQPVTPPGRPSKLTEDDKRYVTRLYKDGTKIAVIAAELDVSEKTVKNEIGNQQRAGILRTRRPNLGDKLILFRLQLDPELNKKIYEGAKRRGSSKADYIRMLIRRDNP